MNTDKIARQHCKGAPPIQQLGSELDWGEDLLLLRSYMVVVLLQLSEDIVQ